MISAVAAVSDERNAGHDRLHNDNENVTILDKSSFLGYNRL